MRFLDLTMNHKVRYACAIAEGLFKPDSKMIQEIRLNNDFKYNSGSGEEVAETLLKDRDAIEVILYTPWRFSRAVGMFDGKAIHISTRALSWMTIEDVTGLLCHEASHYCGFSHGNNYKTLDKVLYSVPYFISENIKRWL